MKTPRSDLGPGSGSNASGQTRRSTTTPRTQNAERARIATGDTCHKLSASLSLNDIFDTQIFRLKIGTSDFSQNMKRKRETRIIQFSLNYRFGQADSKKARQQQENQEKQGGGNMDIF